MMMEPTHTVLKRTTLGEQPSAPTEPNEDLKTKKPVLILKPASTEPITHKSVRFDSDKPKEEENPSNKATETAKTEPTKTEIAKQTGSSNLRAP